jgi:hypothetical protein
MTPQERRLLDCLIDAYPSPGMLFRNIAFPASEVPQETTGKAVWYDVFPKLQDRSLLAAVVTEALEDPAIKRHHDSICSAWNSLVSASSSARMAEPDIESLMEALARLAASEDALVRAFLRVVPSEGFGADLAVQGDLLKVLSGSLVRRNVGDQVPPLLRFANLLNDGQSEEVRARVDQLVERLGKDKAPRWRAELDAERRAPQPAGEGVLCIVIHRQPYEELCSAEAWLYWAADPWRLGAHPFPLDQTLPEAARSWAVQMLERAEAITDDVVAVEFALEHDALEQPLERSITLQKGRCLGAVREVKVRSIERFRVGPTRSKIERLWRARGNPLTDSIAERVDPTLESPEGLEERYHEQPPLSVLFVGERPPGGDYVAVVHDVGVPIALWCREATPGTRWEEAFTCAVRELPRQLQKERHKRSANVVLLWDAPDRAPPVPLRRSARTAERR